MIVIYNTAEPVKVKRAPTPYNTFMKSELAKVKKAQPGLNHKEAFKAAAGNVSRCYLYLDWRHLKHFTKLLSYLQWKNSPANPANKK